MLASRVRHSRTAPVRNPRGRHQESTTGIYDRATARHTTRQRSEDRGRGRDHRGRCTGYGRPGRSRSGGALPDADAIGSGCGCPGSRPARGGVCRWTGGSASAATRRRATGARDPEPRLRPGQTPGQLGYLRDIWHTFHSGNPLDALTAPPEVAPGPPPGAGPAPQLPPGYISLNAPESNGPPPAGPAQGGPPLPPGYYPLNGPPPPGYYDGPHTGPDPAAPLAVTVTPVPPTP